MARRHLIPLIQLRIDEVEADGVGAIIVCCAEEYPPRSFRARIPLVLPYRSGLALVEAAAAELDRPLNVAVLIPGPAWMSQDLVTWHSRPWMSSNNPQSCRSSVRSKKWPRVSVIRWKALTSRCSGGTGSASAPHDPPGLVRDLEALLRAPVVSFHALATREVRCWLRPSHADLAFASAE